MRPVAVLVAAATALVLATAAAAADITRHALTASYSLTLVVGPREAMYTQAQVKSTHPKSGEVIVGGSMAAGSMSAMKGEAERHLEVQIRFRSSGAVVANFIPQITLTDTGGMSMPAKVDVMAMQGIGKGVADRHYGNNVALKPGHTYKVSVVVFGEKAAFTFTA